ncbi:MAG TPA: tRNA (N6-threonylcarbamoyladenosine(37)-N6)-methyltransferase TrmO [Anaerohalosphaeraceae bacterium]|nr:tRNA (N6-threonylcarbamoyladenosine(37)-N6)-methyltransferase TrmO [Anaerohalosphaeraceae bacterium]HOL31516.1 tRNA (N6-threonylcarbamoyladenosine(37)-N6)-methyltransferase TrmO [Anaerohalosphaeraceae bacterium]HOM75561.1 tRNA (N6-threonylcarbamoyladenosine(37)-N6)-methyltransferase TrmO [Anaerohalosphaeraceae bacterium]HPC64343.1 tRNA (N6-threonylcarbamoyladenosine(37)-N6)-methyltransferase TrmO [Anaerohalosphaeraceae bacterium]HPO69153.1 tRNA (N6-threonylcarbamoyladenosine(37)-N6)-methyltr
MVDKADEFTVKAIGIIRTPFKHPQEAPIQPAFAKGAEGVVDIFEPYEAALKDLDGFERIWLIYYCHRAAEWKPLSKPYLDTVERGLFATRAPARPNPIGISSVRLVRIEGRRLYVRDIDALDETPLLDIKPYSGRFDVFETKYNGWMDAVDTSNPKADGRFWKPQTSE